EADERGERHQEYVERIDEEQLAPCRHRPERDDLRSQRRGPEQGQQADRRIQLTGPGSASPHSLQQGTEQRQTEDQQQFHQPLSFSFSRWWMSRLSNVSRIWKKKIPKMKTPTSTSNAIPSSTIIGMP